MRGRNAGACRRLLPVLSLLFVSAPAGARPEGTEPKNLVLLRAPAFEAPYPDGVSLLFGRFLDETGLRWTPAFLPDEAMEELAAVALDVRAGRGGRAARSYLRKTAEDDDLDGLLLLGAAKAGTGYAISLIGSVPPFDSFWAIGGRALPADSAAIALRPLADSAAVRFGAELSPRDRFAPASSEAEDLYARALPSGSLELLLEAAIGAGHAAARSDLGLRLYLRGSRGKGIALLDSVDERGLSAAERLAHRARLAFVSGTDAELAAARDSLRASFPSRPEIELLDGLERARRGDPDGARSRFEKAIEERPADPLLYLLLAEVALRNGYAGAARDSYRRALTLRPHDPLARIGLASILYSDGSLDEAVDLLALPPPADPHGPEGTRPFFLHEAARTGLLLAEGRAADAAEALARVRKDAYLFDDEESLVDLTIRRFYAFLEMGETDSAASELSEARFRADAPFLRRGAPGEIAYLEGLLGAARQDYGTVSAKRLELETIPRASASLPDILEGEYSVRQSSGWEATLPLRRALSRSESALVHYLLGRAYLLSEQSASAIEHLEWVADRGESLLDAPLVLPPAFYYLGRAFQLRGDGENAALAFREYLHYRSKGDASPERAAEARSYLQSPERSESDSN